MLWSTKLSIFARCQLSAWAGSVHPSQPGHGLSGCEHLVKFQKYVWSAGSLANFSCCLFVLADE